MQPALPWDPRKQMLRHETALLRPKAVHAAQQVYCDEGAIICCNTRKIQPSQQPKKQSKTKTPHHRCQNIYLSSAHSFSFLICASSSGLYRQGTVILRVRTWSHSWCWMFSWSLQGICLWSCLPQSCIRYREGAWYLGSLRPVVSALCESSLG